MDRLGTIQVVVFLFASTAAHRAIEVLALEVERAVRDLQLVSLVLVFGLLPDIEVVHFIITTVVVSKAKWVLHLGHFDFTFFIDCSRPARTITCTFCD